MKQIKESMGKLGFRVTVQRPRQSPEDRLIKRALKALDKGDPLPVLDLASRGILPLDAPVLDEAWKLRVSPAYVAAHPKEKAR